jgi:hypothetical protein
MHHAIFHLSSLKALLSRIARAQTSHEFVLAIERAAASATAGLLADPNPSVGRENIAAVITIVVVIRPIPPIEADKPNGSAKVPTMMKMAAMDTAAVHHRQGASCAAATPTRTAAPAPASRAAANPTAPSVTAAKTAGAMAATKTTTTASATMTAPAMGHRAGRHYGHAEHHSCRHRHQFSLHRSSPSAGLEDAAPLTFRLATIRGNAGLDDPVRPGHHQSLSAAERATAAMSSAASTIAIKRQCSNYE